MTIDELIEQLTLLRDVIGGGVRVKTHDSDYGETEVGAVGFDEDPESPGGIYLPVEGDMYARREWVMCSGPHPLRVLIG